MSQMNQPADEFAAEVEALLFSCQQVLDMAENYRYGDVTPRVSASINEHFKQCPGCAASYELDTMVRALIRRSCMCQSAPAELRRRIMIRVMIDEQ